MATRKTSKPAAKRAKTSNATSTRAATPTRERLLNKSAALFAKHGYTHVRLDDIAKVAGATKGSVFWHFQNKRHMYVECVKAAVEAAFTREEFVFEHVDPKEQLHRYLLWISHAMSSSAVTRRLLLHIIIEHDVKLMRELMAGSMGRSYALLSKILEQTDPKRNKTALSFFIYAIFTLNDELVELASVWDPNSARVIGGDKTIRFVEALVSIW